MCSDGSEFCGHVCAILSQFTISVENTIEIFTSTKNASVDVSGMCHPRDLLGQWANKKFHALHCCLRMMWRGAETTMAGMFRATRRSNVILQQLRKRV